MARKKDINKVISDHEEALRILNGVNDADNIHIKNQSIMSERQRAINELLSRSGELTDDQRKKLNEMIKAQSDAIENEKRINKHLNDQKKHRQDLVNNVKSLSNFLRDQWKILQESDKIIRTTVLNLGMSGTKARAMRESFEGSAKAIARLGGSLGDIQAIQEGFANQTGKARALTASMVEDINLIAKGTGLGIEEAAKLGSQFEFMGLDAKRSMEYAQGIVDTSERMGVNTQKVIKNINDNFKKLNTYSFAAGTKGMAQMAADAEKMQVSMQDALSAADAAKGLEKAIDLAANLQVMGGEFAKTDPFEWMYLARNEPDKLTEKISKMTTGIVTFRKNSEGVFEKFISPADRDRLAAVAKSLGISDEEMTKIAQKRAELDLSERQLAGKGLSAKQKEWIQGAMTLNAKTNKLQVSIGGTMKDISDLTVEQAASFQQEQITLKKRAEDALTFNETLKATMDILKASLLPLLKTVNKVMEVTVKPLADLAMKGWGGLASAAGILLAAAGAWKGITYGLGRAAERFVEGGKGGSGGGIRGFVSNMFGKGGAGGGNAGGGGGNVGGGSRSPWFTKAGTIRKGAPELLKAKAMKSLAGGAGVGAAGLGIGAGVGAAAAGISTLAKAMERLDDKKAETLLKIVRTLGIISAIGAAAGAAVAIFGSGAAVAAPGLLAFGGAVALVGAGIGIAAAGIGLMASGFGKLVESSKGAGKDMKDVAKGIALMSASMVGFSFGAAGMLAFNLTMRNIAKNAPQLAVVGDSFKNIATVLSGSKEDFLAVQSAIESISKSNIGKSGAFSQLASILKNPIKVEFADKNVQLATNITMEIDGQKFMHKIFKANAGVQATEDTRIGKG